MAKLITTKGLRVVVRHSVLLREVVSGEHLNIHPAVTSREAELNYLRHLTTQLMPLLLAPGNVNCKYVLGSFGYKLYL